MKRIIGAALSVALGVGAAACSDTAPAGPDDTNLNAPRGMVVSNAQSSQRSASSTRVSGSLAVSATSVAYISAVPGTFPEAVSVAIRNETTGGASTSIAVIDGGFDPVAIDAEAGNELSLTASFTGGSATTLMITVPPRRPPIIVRTNPAKGRTDVALNVQVLAVFSEPVDRSSVTPSSFALSRDGKAVNGIVQVSADGLTAEFIPDSPLQPQTTYTLAVGGGIRDLDGDTLGETSIVTFATSAPPNGWTLQLEAVTATQLKGTVATPTNPVPTLIVKTASGQPVSGVGVSFDLAGGAEFSGSVSNPTAVTNAQGIVTPGKWTLSTKEGSQGLIATLLAEGPTRSVSFRVEAASAAPAQLSVHWSASPQVALPGWEVNAPAIWVTDQFGNRVRVSGVLVHFTVTAGGGQLAKTDVLTDANGYASAEKWTLGPSAGLNSVVASANNLDAATITATSLDPRELTWYDLVGVDNRSTPIDGGSIGLTGNGYFVEETSYGALGGRRWLGGNYTVSGTEITFARYSGTDGNPSEWDTHTLVDDRLSVVWCPPWYDCGFAVPPAEELRKYIKRNGP